MPKPSPARPGEAPRGLGRGDPLLWALGWTVTTLAGVDVDKKYTVFGAIGAVTFSALSGALLHRLLPGRATAPALPGAR